MEEAGAEFAGDEAEVIAPEELEADSGGALGESKNALVSKKLRANVGRHRKFLR